MAGSILQAARTLLRRIAGPEAFLAALPLGMLRAIVGRYREVRLDDRVLRVDLLDQVIAFHLLTKRVWEPRETAFVRRAVCKGDFVVDIGANLGYFTTLMARAVGPSGVVWAFEPDPGNLRLLRANVETNACTSTRIFGNALGDRDASLELYRSRVNYGNHTLVKSGIPSRTEREHVTVSVERFDDVLSRDGMGRRPALIKIDVEGYEGAVLRGMRKTLEHYRPILVLEYDPSYLMEEGEPSSVIGELRALGYREHIADESGTPQPIDAVAATEALLARRDAVNLILLAHG